MTIDWQNTLAVGVVIASGVYVIWRFWRIGRGKAPPCSTCSDCPTSSEPRQLVSLDPPPKKKGQSR